MEIRSGILYVNTVPEEDFSGAPMYRSFEDYGPVTVPDGCLFVLGDNRDDSLDIRLDVFGMPPIGNVVSQVTEVVRPDPRPVE